MTDPEDVIAFWFDECSHEDWFGGKSEFDEIVRSKFSETHAKAEKAELWSWRRTPEGRLAEIIVLDQFSRQFYRGEARAFASDPLALALAQEAVTQNLHTRLEKPKSIFLLMPYMHSESLAVHEEAVKLFSELDEPDTLKYEIAHFECIKKFGRYPKRNEALGRASTPAELEYIANNTGMF